MVDFVHCSTNLSFFGIPLFITIPYQYNIACTIPSLL